MYIKNFLQELVCHIGNDKLSIESYMWEGYECFRTEPIEKYEDAGALAEKLKKVLPETCQDRVIAMHSKENGYYRVFLLQPSFIGTEVIQKNRIFVKYPLPIAI